MKVLTGIKQFIDSVIKWFSIGLLALMTVLVIYQVFARQILGAPSVISEAASQNMFVWLVILGGSYMFGLREHLDITILKDKYSPLVLMLMEILIHATLLVFALTVMINGGFIYASNQMGTVDAALQIPLGVIRSVIPIAGVITTFYAVYNCILAISEFKTGKNAKEVS